MMQPESMFGVEPIHTRFGALPSFPYIRASCGRQQVSYSPVFDLQKCREARESVVLPQTELAVFSFLTKKGRASVADTSLKLAHPFRQDPTNVTGGSPTRHHLKAC